MNNTFFLIFLFPFSLHSELCQSWKLTENISQLSIDTLSESSGISASMDYPNQGRIYHVNDSKAGRRGTKAWIEYNSAPYLNEENERIGTDKDGDGIRDLEKTHIKDQKVEDLESIDVGPCLERNKRGVFENCVYFADIGNNSFDRENLRIFSIAEKKHYIRDTKSKKSLNLFYGPDPNGLQHHNAEAFMVHPITGDLFIITKKTNRDTPSKLKTDDNMTALFYRARRQSILEKLSEASDEHNEIDIEFSYFRSLDLKGLLNFDDDFEEDESVQSFRIKYNNETGRNINKTKAQDEMKRRYLVTDSDFSPDASKFVILTLGGILEISSSFLDSPDANFQSHHIQTATKLPQQEAITYIDEGQSIIYSSEKKTTGPRTYRTPEEQTSLQLNQLDCLN